MAKARRPVKLRKLRKIRKIKPVRKKKVYTKADITTSKLEVKFKKWLKEELKLSIEDQFQLAYKWYDFRIRSTKILIEVDGDYWHCNPAVYKEGATSRMQRRNIINDRRKTAIATSNGYTLIRVWESDFNKKPDEVKKTILDVVKKYYLRETEEKEQAKSKE